MHRDTSFTRLYAVNTQNTVSVQSMFLLCCGPSPEKQSFAPNENMLFVYGSCSIHLAVQLLLSAPNHPMNCPEIEMQHTSQMKSGECRRKNMPRESQQLSAQLRWLSSISAYSGMDKRPNIVYKHSINFSLSFLLFFARIYLFPFHRLAIRER